MQECNEREREARNCYNETSMILMPGIGIVGRAPIVFPTIYISYYNYTQYFNTLDFQVTVSGGDSGGICGICWNTSGNPTYDDSRQQLGTGNGTFRNWNIRAFDGSTQYYIRPYWNLSGIIIYGDVVEIYTNPAPELMISGYVVISSTRIGVSLYFNGNGNGSSSRCSVYNYRTGLQPSQSFNYEGATFVAEFDGFESGDQIGVDYSCVVNNQGYGTWQVYTVGQ